MSAVRQVLLCSAASVVEPPMLEREPIVATSWVGACYGVGWGWLDPATGDEHYITYAERDR